MDIGFKARELRIEVTSKVEIVNDAFVELEKEQETTNCCDTQNEIVTNIESTNDITNDTTIVSGNLKSAIEQELAESSNL